MQSDFVSAVQGGLVQANKETTPERRTTRRQRVLLKGVVTYARGLYSVDCIIRDLTGTGARVTLANATQLPTNVHLINIRDQLAYTATVARRNGLEIGLSIGEPIPIENSDPALAFLKRLWLEKAAR